MTAEDIEAIKVALFNADSCGSIFCDGIADAANNIADYCEKKYPAIFDREEFFFYGRGEI